LVKIAKMVPVGARATIPLAAFLVGVEETQGVKARVRRLLEIASNSYLRRDPNRSVMRAVPIASICGLLLLALIVVANPIILVAIHNVIEHAVKLLS
jgi:hypothetical protein